MALRAIAILAALTALAGAGAAHARETVVLKGDNGYRPLAQRFTQGATIDARGATWRLNNSRNANPVPGRTCKVGNLPTSPYPVRIGGADGGTWLGGRIRGEVPFASAHADTYCNSAGLLVESADFTVRGVRIDQAWDGIRSHPPAGGWVKLDRVWVNGARDDCIENDGLASLEVTDSLLDRCFAGVSLDPGVCRTGCRTPPGPLRYRLDRVLMRVTPYPLRKDDGGVEHKAGPFLKISNPTPPVIEVTNSVFAFEDIRPNMYGRIRDSWGLIRHCSNNRLLYLGGTALPKEFPRPPACFTVVTGAEARRQWDEARNAWLARR